MLLISFNCFPGDVRNPHFVPVWEGNGWSHMNFYVVSATINGVGLREGDEIGVFDGIYCVGAIVLQRPITEEAEGYITISASMNDLYTPFIDGYTIGNPVSFKVWDSSYSIEYEEPQLVVENLYGHPVFNFGSFLWVDLSVNIEHVASPQNVTIVVNGDTLSLTWDVIDGAIDYKVYSSEFPQMVHFEEDLTGLLINNIWTTTLPGALKRFYYVTAIINAQ